MQKMTEQNRASVTRLVLIPSLIALAVTFLRLIGELRHWSPSWFDNEGGGITPSGVSWIIGIVWLPIPFGIYFAARLIAADERPSNVARAILYSVGGFLFLEVGVRLIVPLFKLNLQPRLLLIWAFSVVPALLAIKAWPKLWKVLLVYGLASRIPVAVIMFFAMRGTWGTHYDYGGQVPIDELWSSYIWFGLIPQLVFWVGFTILLGMIAGSITALIKQRKPAKQAARA